jgi:hypothetical protein
MIQLPSAVLSVVQLLGQGAMKVGIQHCDVSG